MTQGFPPDGKPIPERPPWTPETWLIAKRMALFGVLLIVIALLIMSAVK